MARHPQATSRAQLPIFGNDRRLQMNESIDLSITSLTVYGASHKHWSIAWSGGKDSTLLVTFVVWAILAKKVPAPKTLTVLYADTRLELLPLWVTAAAICEELEDKADALAMLGCELRVEVVMAPLDKRFMVYLLGRGVPPPNNMTLRWCTEQIKIQPMARAMEALAVRLGMGEMVMEPHPRTRQMRSIYRGHGEEKILVLTGVRQGESAIRDGRIAMSCGKNGAECGQGWYQETLKGALCDTLAPMLHWRICHTWEWLWQWAPRLEFGDFSTERLAEAYGGRDGDEAAESLARTGCVGCPLAELDTALDGLVRMSQWAYLAPLKRLRPLWRELREPVARLRKPGGEKRKDGSLVANQQRMGPLKLETRLAALDRVLAIQAEVNAAADAHGRPRVDILNAEEEARIRELIAENTWPQKWTGDEPGAEEEYEPILADGSVQGLLFRAIGTDD